MSYFDDVTYNWQTLRESNIFASGDVKILFERIIDKGWYDGGEIQFYSNSDNSSPVCLAYSDPIYNIQNQSQLAIAQLVYPQIGIQLKATGFERLVLYNPKKFDKIKEDFKDSFELIHTFLLAHEVGHLYNNHFPEQNQNEDYKKSSKIKELEADNFGGHVLAMLGEKPKSLLVLNIFLSNFEESNTHPSPFERINAAIEGFKINLNKTGDAELQEVILQIQMSYQNRD